MQQMVITYVLSGLANIADVSPSDVHTSLLSGNVRVNNLSLRTETMNKILPLRIEEGTVPELEVQIPNPSTTAPMEVKVWQARLLLQLDLSSPRLDRTPEQVMCGITDYSILGTALSEPADVSVELQSPVSEPERGTFDFSSADSDMDEEEFASCASDGDFSDSDSVCSGGSSSSSGSSFAFSTSAEESKTTGPAKQGASWIGYLYSRAAQSVEWIWRRQLRITFTDLTLVYPCDGREGINLEIRVDSLVVTVEPPQTRGPEQMKIVRTQIGGASVFANAKDTRSRVMIIEALSIDTTTVYETDTERIVRKNMAFSFNGTSTLMADEATLLALLKCHLSRQTRLSVPPYCLPFSSLRARSSMWPYVKHCVLQGLRDYKQRYNFNASHLHFYAHARERYVQLLNDCHRRQSVEDRRQELADAEQDLRYVDVILFLRRLVQAKYLASNSAPVEAEAVAEMEPLVVSSTHFEWKLVRVILPARNTLLVRNTALVFRRRETLFTIASISLDSDGVLQTMAALSASTVKPSSELHGSVVDKETSLIYVHLRENSASSEVRVSLQRVSLTGSMKGALRCLMPVAEALHRIGEQERCGAGVRGGEPKSPTLTPPRCVMKPSTTTVAVHYVSVQIDDFHFLFDHFSATSVKAPGIPGRLGCTLRQCYLRHKDTYVLTPFEVCMTARGGVSVSRIALEVSRETWTVWRRNAHSLSLLLNKLRRSATAGGAQRSSDAGASPGVNLDALKAMLKVFQWCPVSSCPPLEVEGVVVDFHPLDCTVALHRIATQTVAESSRGPYGTHVTLRHARAECCYTSRLGLFMELEEGMRVGMTTEPAKALVVSIPSLHITGRRGKDVVEVAPLLDIRCVGAVMNETVKYGSIASVSVAGGVQLANVDFVYQTDPTVTPLSDRPCLTSKIEVTVKVEALDADQLSAVPSRAVAFALGEVYNFVCDEIVSEEGYRTFFSCFSDVEVQLVMQECVVRCGNLGGHTTSGKEMFLSLCRHTVSEERGAAQSLQEPPPIAIHESFPISIRNDIKRLSMDIDVSAVSVYLSMPATTSSSSVEVVMSAMHWQIPLGKMPFWCAEAQEIPPVPQKLALESMRIVSRLDRTNTALSPVVDASLSVLTMETFSGNGAAAGVPSALSFSRDFQLSPPESDHGSCASSTEEQGQTIQVSLRRWSVEVDFSGSLSDFGKLQSMAGAIMSVAQCFTHRLVLRESVSATEFEMDDCGDIFLDAPTQMLLVEDCVFRALSIDRHVVVCPGTSAVFRRCVFAYPGGADLIRASDQSSFFLCEECSVEGEATSVAVAYPISTTVPNVESRPGAAVGGALTPWRRLQVTVDEGCAAIGLDTSSRIVLTQRALALTYKRKTRRSFFKLHNSEVRVDYTDLEQRLPVLTKTSIEVELAQHLPHHSCSASCSVTCGEVTIPLLFSELSAVQTRLKLLTNFSVAESTTAAGAGAQGCASAADIPAPRYIVPPPSTAAEQLQCFPYDSWKVLFSLSLIPVTVRLPAGMTVARVTFSNAFMWSKREPFAEAQLEARIALHDMALWEWPQQCFKTIVSNPVFVGLQGRMPSYRNATLTASVSTVEAAVSTDQLKLMRYALSGKGAAATVSAYDTNEITGRPNTSLRALRWKNHADVALQARSGQGTIVCVPASLQVAGEVSSRGPHTPNVLAPLSIEEIDATAVDHVERDVALTEVSGASLAQGHSAPLFVSRKTVILADKRRFHVTSTLDRDMAHTVCVRTLVQIQNDTPLPLVITAGSESARVVEPFDLSCVPEAMLHRPDLSVAVTLTTAGVLTLREPLLPEFMPAADFYQLCHQQGFVAADIAREFISQLDGSSTFMVTAFELQGPVLLLRFRSARPHVVNDTVYPLRIAAVNSCGETLASEYVLAGEKAYFLNLPPTAAVRGDLQLFVEDDIYQARVDEALFDRVAARADRNLVMTHQAHPRRYFFELNLSVDSRGPAGEYGVAVTASYQCLVKNCTTFDLFFTTDDGDSVGTMGTRGLPASSESGAVGYVPSNLVLRIKPKAAALSEAFEIDGCGEGCVIQCDHAPQPSAFSATYFLLRSFSATPTRRLAELLPPVVFRNCHAHHTLCVKHLVRQVSVDRTLEETVFEVRPQSDYSYYTLSKYGFTNDLLFAWRRNAEGPATDPGDFSFVVETDLAPGTTWSGFVFIGATHHQVDISKGSLYETAYVTVSPAMLPKLKVVNYSSIAFRDVDRYQVAFPRPSRNNKYLILTSAEGVVHTVDLFQEESFELEVGVTVQAIRCGGDRCCVVLSSQQVFTTTPKSWAEEVHGSVNIQTNGVSLRLRDASAVPLHFYWRSLVANVMWTHTISVQCSLSGICLENNYEGRRQQVAEPFDAEVSLREMRCTSRDVYLKGFYLALQPLTITVPEVLLYQLQTIATRCRVDTPFDLLAWVREPTTVAHLRYAPVTMPQHLHIGSAGIGDTPLELTWDRSIRPPQDFFLGGSALAKLIPSLHHAMLVLPKFQLRNISRVTLTELIGRIRQILIMEVVKQIPKMVTTVGLFKKNSSLLEKLTSTFSSFLFRSSAETDTTDDGGSALI
ncbi:hypothetical protein JKF63_06483 [Porcisia hertigi]|uniref:Uncharacterized protein n=1 Tax=Porcisia hertigi TaxID=2761500 RepID=A0A836LK44_9TRYP|nr:hypothetical protein JKF63_06483 [Porcisia hertigi]